MSSPTPHFQPFPEISYPKLSILQEKIMLEIVSIDVKCFRKGDTAPNEYYFNHLCNKDNYQCWYPVWDDKVVTKIAEDLVKFERDITHIRVTHINGVTEDLETGLTYRLISSNIAIALGKPLEMIAEKAWVTFSFDPEFEPWKGNTFVGIFEMGFMDSDTEPLFRGFLPMDERLTAIAIPENKRVV
jgi:hypothetical protein